MTFLDRPRQVHPGARRPSSSRSSHALHVYGLPSHRLEAALGNMAGTLGIDAQFLATHVCVPVYPGGFGPEVGMALGAWALGCTSTLLARQPQPGGHCTTARAAAPGTRGPRAALAEEPGEWRRAAGESAFTMTLLAISLVTGLFLANLTLRPRQL